MSTTVLLSLLPFLYYPYIHSAYELPKVWVVIGVAWIWLGLRIFVSKVNSNFSGVMLGGVVVLVGWLVLTSLLSGHFWQSWWGNYYRRDGLWLLLSMVILGLTKDWNISDVKWVGAGSLALAVMTIVSGGNSALTFGNTVFLAGYLAVTLPFVYLLNRSAVVVPIVAIGLLGVWGAWVTVVVFLAYTLIKKYPNLYRLGIVLLVVGVVVTMVGYLQEQKAGGISATTVAESRGRIWIKTMLAIKEKPISGWGWAQYGRVFNEIIWPQKYSADVYVDRAHSSIAEYTVAGGVVAGALYILLVLMATKKLLTYREVSYQYLGVVVLLVFIYSQTNVTSVAVDWLMYMGIGVAVRS